MANAEAIKFVRSLLNVNNKFYQEDWLGTGLNIKSLKFADVLRLQNTGYQRYHRVEREEKLKLRPHLVELFLTVWRIYKLRHRSFCL